MIRSVALSIALAGLAACGTSWEVRDGQIGPGECRLKPWFLDADADGWGDDVEPVWACEAVAEDSFTARNNLDCDDASDQLTARLDAACPVDVLPGADDILAWSGAEAEMFLTFGASPQVSALQAEAACAHWGGALATPATPQELAVVQDRIDTELPGTEPWVGFVGVGWAEGEWAWLDAGVPFESIGLCGGELPVTTYDPLHPDPELAGQPWPEQPIPRLALVRSDAGWCLGEPAADSAWIVCERETPNPSDYPVFLPQPADAL